MKAKELEKKFDEGEDISKYLDTAKARRPEQERLEKASYFDLNIQKGETVIRHRSIKTCSMHLQGTPEQVFPLLCPVREYEWIDGWQCEMGYSDSGFAELGCVFMTHFPGDGPEDTWVVSRYDPPLVIEFVRINALRTIHFSISLTRNTDSTTSLSWTQTFTGLCAEGDALGKNLSYETYRERVLLREKQINYFLSTGRMLLTT